MIATRAELRMMIVNRIKGQPTCPAGMDVVIEGVGRQWEVTCVPPANETLTPECYDLVLREAAKLQRCYELKD